MSGAASDMANRVHDQIHSRKSASSEASEKLLKLKDNPFQSRNEYSRGSVITYRVISALSYLLVVITSIYYTFERPHEGQYSRHTIWDQNRQRHTPFALSSAIISIYWFVSSSFPKPAPMSANLFSGLSYSHSKFHILPPSIPLPAILPKTSSMPVT